MLAWTGLGVVAFLIWTRIEHTWPFGPKPIQEQFLEEQKAEPVQAARRNAA
jgi:fructoselysine transporter